MKVEARVPYANQCTHINVHERSRLQMMIYKPPGPVAAGGPG